MSDQQLSKHRHISFTAHYTGYIWYKMGISHPLLATSKGKRLAMIAHPIESWGERFVGGSMRTTLTQRHTILDDRLHQLIAQFPDLQVLEIAAGLSPRGWWFRQQYAQIDYRELDLPEMAKTKQAALKQIDPNSPEVLSVDLFTHDFQNAFKVFDPQKPLVVISEGLINYFNKNLLKQLIQSIADYGKNFKALHYLTDIYPEPVKNKFATVIWNSSKLLKLMSRSAFTFHFTSPEHARHFISETGFKKIEVIQPSLYFNQNSKQDPEQHLGDLVWVIDAQL
ncbi:MULTISPECIES: class I SAM-dependent methyltransferase [unclassified Acinetobacter]|uniref:class I SAM-dependent methyltransferase n=1 Tax=unclassified Acinetobacter TaxID=196816 RepID=UPI0018ABCE5A|nr:MULTISPECIES: class I SAM-dependent methyltransferase [unclassified Acinetobacter]MBJ9952550.1 class I SAM-dependent methyltransferase [Acinetobacter baumannii]